MGKGDRKTTRGKIWRGSYGNTRPHGKRGTEKSAPAAAAAPRGKSR